MIRWGKAEKINGDKTEVNLNSMKKENGRYSLTMIREAVPFNENLVPGLKINDTVVVHWNQVIKILTPAEEKNIIGWTDEVIRSLS